MFIIYIIKNYIEIYKIKIFFINNIKYIFFLIKNLNIFFLKKYRFIFIVK